MEFLLSFELYNLWYFLYGGLLYFIKRGYYFLWEFISDLIFLIWDNPSLVKWALDFIKDTTLQKLSKSNALDPMRGVLIKNGKILFSMSDNYVTIKSTALERE